MMHFNRVFDIETAPNTLDSKLIAHKLKVMSRADLNKGMKVGRHFFLNDSITTDEDRFQELAVYVEQGDGLKMIDSVTMPKGANCHDLSIYIQKVVSGALDSEDAPLWPGEPERFDRFQLFFV